jgi:hypothetical protein
VASRKAVVVAAVRGGLLSMSDACARYRLTTEEFLSWQTQVDRNGLHGLADARSSNPSGSDHHLVLLQPGLPDDDDPELIRPGPRGDDGEPIQLRPPGWRPDEDEVVEALPAEPEPQLDDNEGE